MPRTDSRKEEFRVFLPPNMAKVIRKEVDNEIYQSPSEAIRSHLREKWFKDYLEKQE